MADERERELARRAAAGDDDARSRLHVAEYRRGDRFKLLMLTGGEPLMPWPWGPLADFYHLVSHRSLPRTPRALCNRLDVRLDKGTLGWRTWAGPDGTADEGRCAECHAIALSLVNEAFTRLFCRQIAYGRLAEMRHPEDAVVHWHQGTGRDLKPDEWERCTRCDLGGESIGVVPDGVCYRCDGRGWIYLVRRRRSNR